MNTLLIGVATATDEASSCLGAAVGVDGGGMLGALARAIAEIDQSIRLFVVCVMYLLGSLVCPVFGVFLERGSWRQPIEDSDRPMRERN